jgi:transcriptional regulator with GAF, ATPase, and Fis domain
VEDIPLLAKHFLSKLFEGKQQPEMEDNIIEYLVKKEYPGNVRELQQLIRRIGLRHVNHRNISLGEIPGEDRLPDHSEPYNVDINLNITLRRAILSGASLWDLKNLTMHEAIRVAMELSNGNKKMAADKLGVTLRAVQQFLKNNQFEPAADDQLN